MSFTVQNEKINLNALLLRLTKIEQRIGSKLKESIDKAEDQTRIIDQALPSPRTIQQAQEKGPEAFDALKSKVSAQVEESRKNLQARFSKMFEFTNYSNRVLDLSKRILGQPSLLENYIGPHYERLRQQQLVQIQLEVDLLDQLTNLP